MRILTPTENKRFNELVGFVGLSLAILLTLSLLSYSPRDASFNVSAPMPASGPARNWIGPFGAHTADLFFQFCGFAAFLFPVGMFVVAMRWFRSQVLEAPVAKTIGFSMLLTSVSAELALVRLSASWLVPDVRGALPPGGFLGALLADSMRAVFNPIGANLVTVAMMLTALFLTTSFSFRAALAWMSEADGWRWSDRANDRAREGVARDSRIGPPAKACGGNQDCGAPGCATAASFNEGNRGRRRSGVGGRSAQRR